MSNNQTTTLYQVDPLGYYVLILPADTPTEALEHAGEQWRQFRNTPGGGLLIMAGDVEVLHVPTPPDVPPLPAE